MVRSTSATDSRPLVAIDDASDSGSWQVRLPAPEPWTPEYDLLGEEPPPDPGLPEAPLPSADGPEGDLETIDLSSAGHGAEAAPHRSAPPAVAPRPAPRRRRRPEADPVTRRLVIAGVLALVVWLVAAEMGDSTPPPVNGDAGVPAASAG